MMDMVVDDSQQWRRKHLKSVEANYRKAPFFEQCFPKWQQLLSTPEDRLVELCWRELAFWLEEFRIGTQVCRLSELDVETRKSDLVLDLSRRFSATQYLSGTLGRNYVVESDFLASGISVSYQDFVHPVYPQLWGAFQPYMGILDYWMNCGPGTIPFFKEDDNEF